MELMQLVPFLAPCFAVDDEQPILSVFGVYVTANSPMVSVKVATEDKLSPQNGCLSENMVAAEVWCLDQGAHPQ